MKFATWIVALCLVVIGGCQQQPASISTGQTSGVFFVNVSTVLALAAVDLSDETSDVSGDDSGFDDFDLFEEDIAGEMIVVYDPIESWNREVFKFNDGVFLIVVKPVVKGYKKIVPEPGRVAIRNFFDNLNMPSQLINCLLQGKWDKANREMARFGINSTIGVLGLFDVAQTKYDLDPVNEDFGQTLAVWGFGDGCYLVWPFIGPSNVRDSVGKVADQFANPLCYVQPWYLSISLSGLKLTNEGSFFIDQYESLTADALDPYVFFRQTYAQYRRKKIME